MYLKDVIDKNEITPIIDALAINEEHIPGYCMGDLVDIGYATMKYVYNKSERGIIWTYTGPNKIKVGSNTYSRGDTFGDTHLLPYLDTDY